ncbi:P-loop containing nucleoside triphosphate hydrolase [Pseudocohnilembus persalinus]|uniref:p-loop containing nucleoside triphosphate hydrolase n=1 Tax=Pseudocohnilembus persalinus TaxID=266149 RepID=A0A0V0Q9F7_PSEPJ|nr:P-loop containing nucleoside triphosphate hydrolase [Pseudocohnilembus persalinus]|eukprot:KRW98660.1 P-loop containing nucleoside triphosphate hydrolase [Pseudocohnilembus persalinus]
MHDKNCVSLGISIVGEYVDEDFYLDEKGKQEYYNNQLSEEYDEIQYNYNFTQIFSNKLNLNQNDKHYLEENQNKVYQGLQFCTGKIPMIDQYNNKGPLYLIDCQNMEFKTSNVGSITLKYQIDKALLAYEQLAVGKEPVDLNIQYNGYPYAPMRMGQIFVNLPSQLSAFFTTMLPILLFFIVLREVTKEKCTRVRYGLNIFGVSHNIYWASWLITVTIFSVFAALYTIAISMAFQIDVFVYTNPIIMFCLYFFYTLGLLIFALLLSTLISDQKTANAFTYSFAFILVIVQTTFLSTSLQKFLYINDQSEFVESLRTFFYFYTPYNYALLYKSIYHYAGYHKISGQYTLLHGISWKEFFHKKSGYLGESYYEKPSPFFFMAVLIGNILLYTLILMYFDNIFESNRGRSKPLYYIFQQKYMCPQRYKQKKKHKQALKQQNDKKCENLTEEQQYLQKEKDDKSSLKSESFHSEILYSQIIDKNYLDINIPNQQKKNHQQYSQLNQSSNEINLNLNDEVQNNGQIIESSINLEIQNLKENAFYDLSAKQEKEKIQSQIQQELQNITQIENVQGIRISNLCKYYKSGIFKKKVKKAVNNVFLHIEPNETVAFLGHNGAGKTTLINVLTGMLELDDGEVIINGKDLKYDLEEIRKEVGICPQFDILWDELTAKEHIELFCQIKGVTDKNKIKDIIQNQLKAVNLSHVTNAQTRTYSGGMKRRLSFVISFIGDPKIVFLDEPTTAMDPKSKREVWEQINILKKNKSILLTSHSMDEVDLLSDRIVVISEGQIKCVGTSLYLKNMHGGGFRLDIQCSQQNQQKLVKLMKKTYPDSSLVDTAGGSLIFKIDQKQINQLIDFLDLMEFSQDAILQKQKILYLQRENKEQKENDQQMEKNNFEFELKIIQQKIEIKTMIIEWCVSHSTLEEVFMFITGKKKSKFLSFSEIKNKQQVET